MFINGFLLVANILFVFEGCRLPRFARNDKGLFVFHVKQAQSFPQYAHGYPQFC